MNWGKSFCCPSKKKGKDQLLEDEDEDEDEEEDKEPQDNPRGRQIELPEY